MELGNTKTKTKKFSNMLTCDPILFYKQVVYYLGIQMKEMSCL